MSVHWLSDVEDHDYDAATQYLSLTFSPYFAKATAERLRSKPIILFYAKDVLRASGLALLPEDNEHVARDLEKIRKGKQLSPILLVRHSPQLIVADGFHRLCAAEIEGENTQIPCKIIDLQTL